VKANGQGHVIGCAKRKTKGIPAGSIVILCHQALKTLKCTAMDITPIFNQVLVRHDAQPVEPYVFRVEDLDEFVKEAYRIVGHVARRTLESCHD
jgi:hypothetical protein